jgi:hypothetical protein
MFVEVKSYRGEMLKEDQHHILTSLAKLGLNCFKWTPQSGFERISPTTPYPEIINKNNDRNPDDRRKLTKEARLSRYSPEEREEILRDEAMGKIRYY